MHEAGVHATLAGVVLALLTPSRPIENSEYVDTEVLADVSNVEKVDETVALARDSVSTVEWLLHVLHPWSSYAVLPVFALANAGIVMSSDMFRDALSSDVSLGVFVGLLVGKPVGICLLVLVGTQLLRSPLPDGVRFAQLAAAALLGGIGFTVSLFVGDLAFDDAQLVDEAKVGVLAASAVAAIVGWTALRVTLRNSEA